ncbi:MAG: biotin transporter BioY [Microbacterium sp.]|uniref:biotin transporter BioY n=1 Tax=Microbacterium sp. TaxID=51671 RepID=UPI0039E70B32
MSLAAASGPRVLADALVPTRSRAAALVADAALVVAGTALVAVAAQVAIPFWPVPLTLQTFAVLLVGTALGPVRGASSLGLYLVLGVVGLPIFSEGASGNLFAMTSGGFIVGFVFAAALTGWLARRRWDRKVVGTLVSFLAGSVVMYAFGLPWLYVSLQSLGAAVWHDYLGYDSLLAATIGAGLLPFLVGDVLKAIFAAVLLPLTWRGVDAVDARTAR